MISAALFSPTSQHDAVKNFAMKINGLRQYTLFQIGRAEMKRPMIMIA
jgi:hypothetical protein